MPITALSLSSIAKTFRNINRSIIGERCKVDGIPCGETGKKARRSKKENLASKGRHNEHAREPAEYRTSRRRRSDRCRQGCLRARQGRCEHRQPCREGATGAGCVIWVQHSDEQLALGSDHWHIVSELAPGDAEPLVEKRYGDSFEATMLQTDVILFEHEQEAFTAMIALKDGTGSLADALIGALGTKAGCARTLSFDRKASRIAGFELL